MAIINTPLADEFGHELGGYLSRQRGCLVLLLVKNEIAEEMSIKVQRDGMLVLAKPINRGGFIQAVAVDDFLQPKNQAASGGKRKTADYPAARPGHQPGPNVCSLSRAVLPKNRPTTS